MLTEINRIKQDSIFTDKTDFLNLHRDNFTQSLVGYLDSVEESEHFYRV